MYSNFLILALAAFGPIPQHVWSRALPNPDSPTPPTATSFPNPNFDPFYHVPANIASYPPGNIVRSRKVAKTTEFGSLVNTREVFYRTNDRSNKATGTVATLFIPAVPASPPKIFSYQSAEDAVKLDCNPSWANVNSSSEQESYLSPEIVLFVTWSLAQGYYVVNADDEGPLSSWLVGKTEGRATLDGIRATINDLNLPKAKTEVALLGYSGGAHETVWACSQAADGYAPELNIAGAAYGGTPVDLLAAYDLLNGTPQSILAGGALVGLAKGYPELNAEVNALLTAKGKRLFRKLRGPDACLVEHGSDFTNVNFSSPAIFKGGNIQKNPVVARIVSGESLLSNVSQYPIPVPKFPRYEWHGLSDTTVPYAPEASYVKQQCSKGANIKFVSYPGLDHGSAAVVGVPGALLFLDQAFNKLLVKTPCGANISTPAIGSAEAIKVLGKKVDNLLQEALAGSR